MFVRLLAGAALNRLEHQVVEKYEPVTGAEGFGILGKHPESGTGALDSVVGRAAPASGLIAGTVRC